MDQIKQTEIHKTPFSPEAEVACLGSILLDNDLIDDIFTRVSPDDFYDGRNKLIASAIFKYKSADRAAVDIITLQERLQSAGVLSQAGGAAYLSQLLDIVPTTANALHYAEIVQGKALQRRIIKTGNEIIQAGSDAALSPKDALNRAEELITKLDNEEYSDYYPFKTVLSETIEKISIHFSNKGKTIGIPTGFKEIDSIISGFQDSHLIILGGRPGMGKTTFALSIMENMAIKSTSPVCAGFFSLEMTRDQLCERILCSEAKIKFEMLQKNHLNDKDISNLKRVMNHLADKRIFIDDAPGLTLFDISAKARRMKREHDCNIIFVDYLQLIRQPESSNIPREQFIASVSRGLKHLARELHIPVIALVQLNRGVEGRTGVDKRPGLADIRESGSIEQDADLVIFVHRPAYYEKDEEKKAEIEKDAEIIIAKNRHGRTSKVDLMFDAEFARFENRMHEH